MLRESIVFESIYSDSYDELFVDDIADLKAEVLEEILHDIKENYRHMITIDTDEVVMRYKYNEVRVPNPCTTNITFEEISVNVREEIEYNEIKEEDATYDSAVTLEHLSDCEEYSCVVVKSYSFTLDATVKCNKKVKSMSSVKSFKALQQAIYKADPLLGRCFESSVRYIEFFPSEGVWKHDFLAWEIDVNKVCQKTLTHGYSIIKPLVKELFSQKTEIVNYTQGCSVAIGKNVDITYENIGEDIKIYPPVI